MWHLSGWAPQTLETNVPNIPVLGPLEDEAGKFTALTRFSASTLLENMKSGCDKITDLEAFSQSSALSVATKLIGVILNHLS